MDGLLYLKVEPFYSTPRSSSRLQTAFRIRKHRISFNSPYFNDLRCSSTFLNFCHSLSPAKLLVPLEIRHVSRVHASRQFGCHGEATRSVHRRFASTWGRKKIQSSMTCWRDTRYTHMAMVHCLLLVRALCVRRRAAKATESRTSTSSHRRNSFMPATTTDPSISISIAASRCRPDSDRYLSAQIVAKQQY